MTGQVRTYFDESFQNTGEFYNIRPRCSVSLARGTRNAPLADGLNYREV